VTDSGPVDSGSTDAGPVEATGHDTAAYWDGRYRADGAIWGETPSELAAVAIERLRALGPKAVGLSLLDLGCGYGRDALALWRALGMAVVGVDGAARAIEMARAALPTGARIEYRCANLADSACAGAGRPRFDAVYCSNVYQLLGPAERAALRVTVRDQLAPGGLFFLSTLSTRDPQHAGKGRPVRGEPGSFVERTYLHLCHRAELAGDFDFLRLERLDEIAYREERLAGAPHDHVSWVVVGRAS
jgi:SAM-dependent methyltransferase